MYYYLAVLLAEEKAEVTINLTADGTFNLVVRNDIGEILNLYGNTLEEALRIAEEQAEGDYFASLD